MRQPRRKPACGRCPTEAEIELLILTDSPTSPRSDLLAQHVHGCARCRSRAEELSRFYDLLLSSLSAPVSACVLDYVFHRSLDVKEVAHFALRPLKAAQGSEQVFRCEQVGRIPGEALEDAAKGFAAQVLAGGEAGLYALKAGHAPTLLLFFWTPDNGRPSGRVFFPALEKGALLSSYGMAVLEQVELAQLDGQELHLYAPDLEPATSKTRIQMIRSTL